MYKMSIFFYHIFSHKLLTTFKFLWFCEVSYEEPFLILIFNSHTLPQKVFPGKLQPLLCKTPTQFVLKISIKILLKNNHYVGLYLMSRKQKSSMNHMIPTTVMTPWSTTLISKSLCPLYICFEDSFLPWNLHNRYVVASVICCLIFIHCQ